MSGRLLVLAAGIALALAAGLPRLEHEPALEPALAQAA
jgi:hypothetical protein